MKRAACSSCQAPIVWAISNLSGSRIPIDFAPVDEAPLPRGLFVLVKRIEEAPLAWSVAPDAEGLETFRARRVALYRSHFATCPTASQHRRPRAAAGRRT